MGKLLLIKCPKTDEEIALARLEALEDVMFTGSFDVVPEILELLYYQIDNCYEGHYVENFLTKIKEAQFWYEELNK